MVKKQVLIALLVMGLFLITTIPQGVVAVSYNSGTVNRQFGANNTNGSVYMQVVAKRIMLILGIIGAVMIAGLWIFIAMEFFSTDPQRKAQAKEHLLWGVIGTIIIAMAVGGMIWLVARWIAGV